VKHVAIVTGLPLCRNPRVVKEASTLRAAGYRVTVLGPVFSDEHEGEDARIAAAGGWQHRCSTDLRAGRRQAWHLRFRRRLGAEMVRRWGWQTPLALGYGLGHTFRRAHALGADLYICHLEPGLWIGQRLAAAGHRVGFDFEDWYSEDLLPESQQQRPLRLLRRLEAAALHGGVHVTTTSYALAAGLAAAFEAPSPTVVYNAFPWEERIHLNGQARDRKDKTRPSLHWVSQTIGPGRGLDVLFEALERVETPVEVHLRGACSEPEAARLRALFPARQGHALFLHDLVPTDALLGHMAEHDIGLALEDVMPPSRDLTVTNKILHYLLAGLAVVATDTAGQREVASAASGAVHLCRAGDAAAMASALNVLVTCPERLQTARASALEAARRTFCWERQAPGFLASVARALEA
jgi:glycosyltransferase involved in cell wall biosynthesis